MTKKDYIMIAEAVVTAHVNGTGSREAVEALEWFVHEIALALKRDNSAFDSRRFTQYISQRVNQEISQW
jgi:hypothetical protein